MHCHAGNEVMVVLTTTQESLSLHQARPVENLMQILVETASETQQTGMTLIALHLREAAVT